jgi:serine/threonine protein kinase
VNKDRLPYLQLIEGERVVADRFTDIKRIDQNGGSGYFSLIFTTYDKETKNEVILKFFDPTKQDVERLKRFDREAEMLKLFESEPYVLDIVYGPSELITTVVGVQGGLKIPLVFKFMAVVRADLSIEHFIYSEKQREPLMIILLFKEMIKAIVRVHNHEQKVCHRDVKPSNFLIVGDQVCLSDFGAAKSMDGREPDISPSYRYHVGDYNYVSPEIRLGVGIADQYAFRGDFFAMGAILFEMFTQTMLTDEIYDRNLLSRFALANQIMIQMTREKKVEMCKEIVCDLANSVRLPDIYSYNSNVPNCIKHQLNDLYKELAAINFLSRLNHAPSIHRRLDICIKILKNEKKYIAFQERKKERKLARLKREARQRKSKEDMQC